MATTMLAIAHEPQQFIPTSVPTIMSTQGESTVVNSQKIYHSINHDYRPAFLKNKYIADNDGNAEAQFYTGYCYENGVGVTQDFPLALNYYTLASNQDCVNAQLRLADMYFNGKGTPKDKYTACEFWRLASNNGSLEARAHLKTCRK